MSSFLSPQFKYVICSYLFAFFNSYGYITILAVPVSQRAWARIPFRPNFFSGLMYPVYVHDCDDQLYLVKEHLNVKDLTPKQESYLGLCLFYCAEKASICFIQ